MPDYIEDENGYVTFPGTLLSRAGVFPYLGREIDPAGKMGLSPDAAYNVYRPESELNNPETIESFKLSPWFPRHEMAGDDFTAAEEIGVQGTTGQDVQYIEGKGLAGTVKVFGTKLKAAIRAGLRELSCGFRCSWEVVSGTTPDGVKYDVVQRNIRGNHLASVDEGRMGSQFSVAMDRACIALDNLKPEGATMTLEEMMEKVREAEPAKEELAKLHAEIGKMLGDGEGEGGDPKDPADPAVGDEDDDPVDPALDEGDDPKDPTAADADKDKAMDEDKGKTAMDAMAKTIKRLEDQVTKLSGNALDAATIEKQIEAKQGLIRELQPVVGKIDGTGLDANGVAKKAADILGIACDSKSALASVRGYLHARQNTQTTVDRGAAQDAATATAVTSKLDEMGL